MLTLTGENTKDTTKLVDRFQRDPSIQYFILSMKVGGQGITLTAAAHVVFAELDGSPATIEQCHDRCHRIGQKRPVRVTYFVLGGTLEGYMLAAIGRKVITSRAALNPSTLKAVANKQAN